ncbi:uncharacterized protein LOC127711941 [Mytilus californianus]|uniref:uncharacterized protein LOC127711941 n=1 Tax=Mytilus californianus TaxID=6549 RepID=UPI002247EFF1|nr:uncharacterized protein LOC127711941 [Mytilus californianus]
MRSSEEERIFQLLYLLYDVCRDTLLVFFADKFLNNELTDENISHYISKNKNKLHQQLQKSKCQTCSESKAETSCLKFQRELLKSFFKVDKSLTKDANLTDVTSDLLSVEKITPDKLTVSMLHNLLLTAEIDSEEREWIGQLYEQRKQFSSMAITDEKFQEIWRKSEEIVLNISRKYSKGQDKIMEKYIKVIKTMLPQWDMVEDAWQSMEKEFHLQDGTLYADIALKLKCRETLYWSTTSHEKFSFEINNNDDSEAQDISDRVLSQLLPVIEKHQQENDIKNKNWTQCILQRLDDMSVGLSKTGEYKEFDIEKVKLPSISKNELKSPLFVITEENEGLDSVNPDCLWAGGKGQTDSAFLTPTFQEPVYDHDGGHHILYADFPSVKVKAKNNYVIMIDDKIVASMKEGEIYYLIKQVDDWWEVTTLPGASFFIKSECAEIVGPNKRLMTRNPKTIRREFRFPSSIQKRTESAESDIDGYEIVDFKGSKNEDTDQLYETPWDLRNKHELVRKMVSESGPRTTPRQLTELGPRAAPRQWRRNAVNLKLNPSETDGYLTPQNIGKVLKQKRSMSLPLPQIDARPPLKIPDVASQTKDKHKK